MVDLICWFAGRRVSRRFWRRIGLWRSPEEFGEGIHDGDEGVMSETWLHLGWQPVEYKGQLSETVAPLEGETVPSPGPGTTFKVHILFTFR
jgi:hypothetical protein